MPHVHVVCCCGVSGGNAQHVDRFKHRANPNTGTLEWASTNPKTEVVLLHHESVIADEERAADPYDPFKLRTRMRYRLRCPKCSDELTIRDNELHSALGWVGPRVELTDVRLLANLYRQLQKATATGDDAANSRIVAAINDVIKHA